MEIPTAHKGIFTRKDVFRLKATTAWESAVFLINTTARYRLYHGLVPPVPRLGTIGTKPWYRSWRKCWLVGMKHNTRCGDAGIYVEQCVPKCRDRACPGRCGGSSVYMALRPRCGACFSTNRNRAQKKKPRDFAACRKGANFATANKAGAPLAQLVEQLTLNQWVQGSSP